MKERIQKILSARGVCSRRKAEEWIAAGRVQCNGIVCGLGDTADPDTDSLLLDGKPLPAPAGNVYILLNKPRGYVTTLSDEMGRKCAADLVTDCGVRVYPVGRLDMDSEGLLLFTNDGAFANRLMHPSHQVEKEYLVRVAGCTDAGLEAFQKPMELDGYRLRIPKVQVLKREGEGAILSITIHEGRNRQVRRMCALAGMNVLRLRRVREGNLRLGDLPAGRWRYLTRAEQIELTKEG